VYRSAVFPEKSCTSSSNAPKVREELRSGSDQSTGSLCNGRRSRRATQTLVVGRSEIQAGKLGENSTAPSPGSRQARKWRGSPACDVCSTMGSAMKHGQVRGVANVTTHGTTLEKPGAHRRIRRLHHERLQCTFDTLLGLISRLSCTVGLSLCSGVGCRSRRCGLAIRRPASGS